APFVPPDPEPPPEALAYARALRLAELMLKRPVMGKQSRASYRRMPEEQRNLLIARVKELHALEIDVYDVIGGDLWVLKQAMPRGIKWKAYLKEQGMPFGKSRADEYISVFRGRTTALQIKEKKAESVRKARAKQPLRSGQSVID